MSHLTSSSSESEGTEKFVIFENPEMATEWFSNMREIRRQGKLCDITIKVDQHTFSAHKIVLAATIPYFHAMFFNDMAESRATEITMKDIEPLAVESIINFVYSGSIRIDSHNVQILMCGASFLQLTKLLDACCKFLTTEFRPQNILGIRQFADMLGCNQLILAANNFICKEFCSVVCNEEFLNLDKAQLIDVIQRDELNVPSEEPVFEACMRWIKYDEQRRIELLPQILGRIRLPLLSPRYLVDRVATEESIRGSHICRDLLDEAKDCHLMPERRALVANYKIKPRSDIVVGTIYAVGGLTGNGESVSTVEMYDVKSKTWKMGEAMSMLRSRVGVAVTGGKLYAFGGFNGGERLSTVEIYDPKLRTWQQGSAMLCKRSAVGVVALGDFIYVCGGYDGETSLNSVERYDSVSNTWSMVQSMHRYRSAGGVAALDGYVYAMGGHDGLSIFDSVERYDPKTNTWTIVKSMLNRRCRLGVTSLNNKVYACGGYDGEKFLTTVEAFDPAKNVWTKIAPMNVKRSRVALVANLGKLWAIGGYDGESNLSSVEVYDPATDTWTFVAPMCAHGGGVGAGVIPNSYY